MKNLQTELQTLLKEGIIDTTVAQRINDYYASKSTKSDNRLLTIFSILGATLVGLGIILMLAHNWDEFTRPLKTILAFLPLLIGQIACFYVILKKPENQPWREGSATFLFFALGACISLISQIYNIPGNMATFLLSWMALSIPIVYIMRASMPSLLYLIGISWFVGEASYWGFSLTSVHYYWLLLIGALPYYILLIKKSPGGNFTNFHHWFLLLSVSFSLGAIGHSNEDWLFIAYIALFATSINLRQLSVFQNKKAFSVIGHLGTIIPMYILSFDTWGGIGNRLFDDYFWASPEFYSAIALSALAIWSYRYNSNKNDNLTRYTFALFTPVFIAGSFFPGTAQIVMNLLILAYSVVFILDGTHSNSLGKTNYGLAVISVLVICRFFDTDLSFITRGLIFIGLGAAFFASNTRIIKRKKELSNEN